MRPRVLAAMLAAALVLALAAPVHAQPASDRQSMFGRMFPAQPTAATPQQLADLAQVQFDPNLDADNSPSGLPSAFTYFGQFIDHDLTLDLSPSPTATVDPTTLVNQRRFFFDLDSVYGGGPSVSPQLYQADRTRFIVNPNAWDLPRNPDGSAILVEKRNDENQIIAQIHAAMLAFHNGRVAAGANFKQAQDDTIAAYRYVVRNEFLPAIVSAPVLAQVVAETKNNPKFNFYDPGRNQNPMTPVEFSVAAYRFGHSQVRRAYRLNGTNNCANLQVFSLTDPLASLMGGRPIPVERRIAWGQFLLQLPQPAECAALVAPPPGSSRNVSRKIDLLLSSSLFQLPIPGAEAEGSNVLGFRNLIRAKFYDLPSGQAVARAMGLEPLVGADLLPAVIPTAGNGSVPAERQAALRAAFAVDTPLWFYILAEANRTTNGASLGPVGGRIVAEVFLDVFEKLKFQQPAGQPTSFGLADFLVLAGIASRTLETPTTTTTTSAPVTPTTLAPTTSTTTMTSLGPTTTVLEPTSTTAPFLGETTTTLPS